jgi:hypothetical protein
MKFNYDDLEDRFHCACKTALSDLDAQYESSYHAGGPGKLSIFLELIQMQFDQVESVFIKENKLHADIEALRRIRILAKDYAKQCLNKYGKMST